MPARHAVLLTPLESAVLRSIPISIQIAPVASLECALTNHFQLIENTAALSLAESALTSIPLASPLESALTKNTGGGGPFFPFWNSSRHSSLATVLKFFPFTFLRTLLRFFALCKNSTLFFSSASALFHKIPGVGCQCTSSEFRSREGPLPTIPRLVVSCG